MSSVVNSLLPAVATAGGMILSERGFGMLRDKWVGDGPPTTTQAMVMPVAIGAAGYYLSHKGGMVGNLGKGAMIVGVLHLAGRFLGGWDTDFAR